MAFTFQPDDGTLARELVESTVRASGKWFGPYECTLDGKTLVDRKYPIDAPRSIVHSRKNKSFHLSFSLHYRAVDPAAAQALFASYFADLPGATGTLTLWSKPFTGAVISGATLTNRGAYLNARITVEF